MKQKDVVKQVYDDIAKVVNRELIIGQKFNKPTLYQIKKRVMEYLQKQASSSISFDVKATRDKKDKSKVNIIVTPKVHYITVSRTINV